MRAKKSKPEHFWNLNDIMPLREFNLRCRNLEEKLGEIGTIFDSLHPTMDSEAFKKVIVFTEELAEEISRIYHLPSLMESLDQKSAKAKLLKERAKNLYLKLAKQTQKISHWLIGKSVPGKDILDGENAKRLFSSLPNMEYVLSYGREAAKHTLSENEENIILQKNTLLESALLELREAIETDFTFTLERRGKKPKTVETSAEIRAYTHNINPDIRKSAYLSFLKKYKENIDKFFLIYQSVVKNWAYEANLRGHSSPIGMRNFSNHIPDKAIETMLSITTKNKNVFTLFFEWKRKRLGLKKMTRFDLYAPVSEKNRRVSLGESIKTVLRTFQKFSPSFAEKAKLIIDSGHLDSHPKRNKQDGAFCATVSPKIVPYVLTNHVGKIRDISTLAHELGHGVHSLYARDLSTSAQNANLPLAETASTLGELILFEELLERENDAKVKQSMLSSRLADSYATILRQNYFIRFEIEAHERIPKGVTAEDLSDIWLETIEDQFGKQIEIHPIFRYEWAQIPHIFNTPFYCYAYNFGELLSLSLFQKYKKEGPLFVSKIEKMLSYGGSKSPQEVLQEIAIDINSPNFWDDGFKPIREWQELLESI